MNGFFLLPLSVTGLRQLFETVRYGKDKEQLRRVIEENKDAYSNIDGETKELLSFLQTACTRYSILPSAFPSAFPSSFPSNRQSSHADVTAYMGKRI